MQNMPANFHFFLDRHNANPCYPSPPARYFSTGVNVRFWHKADIAAVVRPSAMARSLYFHIGSDA
jgi:hypothetical protein